MTLFLRNEKNETILDLEVWVKTEDSYSFVELSSSIDINNYSLMLIKNTDKEKQIEMISDFDELSELRGWLWEVFFMVKKYFILFQISHITKMSAWHLPAC